MKEFGRKVSRISEKLAQVIKQKPNNAFGKEGHGFSCRKPLKVSDVEKFEAQYAVELPTGYRTFITQVANGGLGPAYGMFSLDDALRCRVTCSPIDDFPKDILKVPFKHTSPYNPDQDDTVISMFDRVETGDITEEEIDIYQLYLTSGTLTLCHEGCGYLHRLVVSGPTRGQMWLDGECSEQGYYPLGVSFLEWYENWLDDVIAGGPGTWWFDV